MSQASGVLQLGTEDASNHVIDVTSPNFNFTTGATGDAPIPDLLVMAITWIESTLSVSGISLDSVSFNGVALTLHTSVSSGVNNEFWYLLFPDIGTYNVNLTWGGPGIAEGGLATAIIAIAEYQGVDIVNPLGTIQTSTGTGTSGTVTIPGVDFSSFLLDNFGVSQTPGFVSRTESQGRSWDELESGGTPTPVFDISASGGNNNRIYGDKQLQWTLGGSRPWAYWGIEIRSAVDRGPLRAGQSLPF